MLIFSGNALFFGVLGLFGKSAWRFLVSEMREERRIMMWSGRKIDKAVKNWEMRAAQNQWEAMMAEKKRREEQEMEERRQEALKDFRSKIGEDYSRFLNEAERPGVLSRRWVEEVAASSLERLTKFSFSTELNPEEQKGLRAIGSGAFAGSQMESIVIPEGVTVIGPYAFAECANLKMVVLPKSLTIISRDAFRDCRNLHMPNLSRCRKLEKIGERAFTGVSNEDFVSLRLPKNLRELGHFAFFGCTELQTVDFTRGSKLEVLGYKSFGTCLRLREVRHIPARITKLAYSRDAGMATAAFCNTPFLHETGAPGESIRTNCPKLEAFAP